MLRIAPRAAAASVQLPVIWRLGGKFVASLLAASYPPKYVYVGGCRDRLGMFMGMFDDGIITRCFHFDFSAKPLHENNNIIGICAAGIIK